VRVVDWHSRIFDNPLYNIPNWLLDGVHPKDAGLAVWMSLIANAIDAYGVGTLPGGDTHG
jgi:lysophospholipase L1-like esterase